MPHAHEIEYQLYGSEMQFVEVILDPAETVVSEAGAMMYMDGGIVAETRFGDGSEQGKGLMGKLVSGAKRLATGESLFLATFTNRGQGKQAVAFAAPYPGKIVPLDLAQYGTMLCQKDSYLCSADGIEVGIAFNRKFGAGLFGGEGFILQKLQGDGLAFIHAGGTIHHRDLAAGEVLRLDTGCLVAFQESVSYEIEMQKNLKTAFFGGEGLFMAILRGPGRVFVQSLPFSRLAGRIYKAAPQTGGGGQGEGSALGGIFNALGGD